MNEILQKKIDELDSAQQYDCWYLVKQDTSFTSLCYQVSFLKRYQDENMNINLQEYIKECANELKTKKKDIHVSDTHRSLRVAAFFGLIVLSKATYKDALITETFFEITDKCNGEYEKTDLYIDIIQRQIEKIYISSIIDEEYNGVRKQYRLYPVLFLYKILLEIGHVTKTYSISINEYRYFISTTKRYEDFLSTLLLIKLLRESPEVNTKLEMYRQKVDSRLIQALKQLPTLEIDNSTIQIKPNKLDEVARIVFDFENHYNHFDMTDYINFLGSKKSIHDVIVEQKLKNDSILIDFSYLYDLPNKNFAFECLRLMEVYGLITYENLEFLTDKAKCRKELLSSFPILKQLENNKDINEQCFDSTGNQRYYFEIKEYLGVSYVITNDWYYGNDTNRNTKTPFVNWIIEKIKNNTFIGYNKIYYGIPGCGKSYHIEHNVLKLVDKEHDVFRTTFYLDYSNSDFIGQIYPKVEEDKVTYENIPGPFTKALKRAFEEPNRMIYLVIEEINRGNAAAIFGDTFQLLDRLEENHDGRVVGDSEYPISNEFIESYLGSLVKKGQVYIPHNLTILATMNTSDQNVFPLDTAFKRRWDRERIVSNWDDCVIKDMYIPFTDITWKNFAETMNDRMVSSNDDGEVIVSEDKKLGAYFASKQMLVDRENRKVDCDENKIKLKKFVSNVIDYLYNDVTKFDHTILFEEQATYDDIYEKMISYQASSGKDLFLHVLKETIEPDMLDNLDDDDNE